MRLRRPASDRFASRGAFRAILAASDPHSPLPLSRRDECDRRAARSQHALDDALRATECKSASRSVRRSRANPEWVLSDHETVHENYFRNRDRKKGLRVHRTFEAGLSLVLAKRHRVSGDARRAQELLSFAVENYPGHQPLRSLEDTFDPGMKIDWRPVLLPGHDPADLDNKASN